MALLGDREGDDGPAHDEQRREQQDADHEERRRHEEEDEPVREGEDDTGGDDEFGSVADAVRERPEHGRPEEEADVTDEDEKRGRPDRHVVEVGDVGDAPQAGDGEVGAQDEKQHRPHQPRLALAEDAPRVLDDRPEFDRRRGRTDAVEGVESGVSRPVPDREERHDCEADAADADREEDRAPADRVDCDRERRRREHAAHPRRGDGPPGHRGELVRSVPVREEPERRRVEDAPAEAEERPRGERHLVGRREREAEDAERHRGESAGGDPARPRAVHEDARR